MVFKGKGTDTTETVTAMDGDTPCPLDETTWTVVEIGPKPSSCDVENTKSVDVAATTGIL